MRVSQGWRWLAALTLVALGASAAADAGPDAAGGGAGKTVFVLPIHGPIDKSMLFVFRRAFREVRATAPAAIVLDVDTPGGRLNETEEIVTWLRSVEVPTYAFVNPRALSAGAIISLGTDAIFMAPGASIGSAMPIALNPLGGGVQQLPPEVQEKMLSAVRAMVRGLAQENGYSEEVAVAMVDASREVRIGDRVLCREGELLNLTGKEACEVIPPATTPVLARAIVEDVDALLENVGLAGGGVVRFEEEAAERLARYITMIGPLLLALGLLGIYIEIKTPGFGFPGIAGIILLVIYLFGHYVAGLAGVEDIVLVMLGVVLLAVEVFVTPGFGVLGLAGLICIGAGVVLGMVPHLPSGLPSLPDLGSLEETIRSRNLQEAMLRSLATVALGAAGVWGLSKILPKTSVYHSLVLQSALTQGDGYVASDAPRYNKLLAREGVTLTPLRPAGIAVIDDKRVDVVSSGDLIPREARIRVIQVEGARVVVERV